MDKDDFAWSRRLTVGEWEDFKAGKHRIYIYNPQTGGYVKIEPYKPVSCDYRPSEAPNHTNIATEAINLVLGDRNDSYGDPGQDYAGTAKVWSGLLIQKLKPGVEITPREAILMMAALKIRREVTKPKRDNRVDAIGYVLCADIVARGVSVEQARKEYKNE